MVGAVNMSVALWGAKKETWGDSQTIRRPPIDPGWVDWSVSRTEPKGWLPGRSLYFNTHDGICTAKAQAKFD